MSFNPSKLLFFITLVAGSFITISSNSWLGAWMGLEINLLSFIPLMMDTNNLLSTEASLKYFLTQALASAILLFSILIFMINTNMSNFIEMNFSWLTLIINSCLLLKSGAAPFHFWFPNVMEGLNWMNNLILLTFQKLAPLTLISYSLDNQFIIYIIIFSIVIGSIGGLNQTSLRKVMAYSSINHLGWILSAMILSESLWLSYFIMYCFLTFSTVSIFNLFKLYYLNQLFSIMNNSTLIKFSMFTSLLSLGGLPPFLGFIPKWLVIQALTKNELIWLMTLMVSLTLITLYFYMRIFYSSALMNFNEMSWNFKILNLKNYYFILILNFLTLSGLFLIFIVYSMI
uniref:NADH-ubiquinone oxidoreductase chain 2 n=1 Tax=Blepharicera ostensackeni TaxID=547859 RepID=V9I0S4_9DIPT|nr:NADH dehydrogenase subunit 2 [Blepharicera ostensackeni]